MVRNTVANELQSREHPSAYFAYSEVDESPGHTIVITGIETPEGVVSNEKEENGQPIADGRRSRNAQQLQKLILSPKTRGELLKSQQEEMRRRTQLLKDFPSAFLFQFDGIQPDGVVHLKFRPNPQFRPVSQEDLVLRGVTGDIWIDPQCQRLVKVEGTLTREVTLGWGMLVRLYPGGHCVMQQAEVRPGDWRTRQLAVDLDGKMLLFKNLKVRVKQMRDSFRPVASNLTVPQAVAMLRGEPQ